jgi:hypothetical protein
LLSHLSARDEDVLEFVSLCHLNRNPAIVIDSDRDSKETKINETKERVLQEFQNLSAFFWITAGREIENYIDESTFRSTLNSISENSSRGKKYGSFEKLLHSGFDKMQFARKVGQESVNFDVLDLREKVHQLVAYIQHSNDVDKRVM